MSNSCYVPNCDETAEEAGEKCRLIFKAPSTGVSKWLKYLPRRAKPFNPKTEGICLKHFEERYIQKEEVVTICGEREVFKLDPWVLTSDAVPTIFPHSDASDINLSSVAGESASGNDDFQPSLNDDDDSGSMTFDDLIRFDSMNGTGKEEDDDATGGKRKSVPSSRPGPNSKKLKVSEVYSESILPDDGEEFGETKFETPSGRPAHLKREIVAPSRIRESMTSESPSYDNDEDYADAPSPESPPSPRRGGRGGGRGGKRGRPRGSGSARGRKTPARKEPIKIKLSTTYPAKVIPAIATPMLNQRREGGCFIEYCDHNPTATLFKMPQQTKAKLKDWLRYIPAAALVNVPFDPRIHVLCEDHFDKKFVMNTPKGKILTGDAIPSIFAYYPKQGFSGKKERVISTPKPKKPKTGPKSRVEVVDGYEIEYDSDPDYSPVTVTIDDDDDEPSATEVKKPPPTPVIRKPGPASAVKSTGGKPAGKILEITDAGYNLQYIYTMKDRIQLPQAEFWMFRLLTDKETKTRCIFIAEIVSRLERLLFRRSIKIRQDLTFRVEANGIDFTQMFNETGHKVESLYKLQEMILDLSAFKVCEGWAQFETVEPSPIGRKIQGIWFANNCEGLNLNSSRCRACVALKLALTTRKSGLSLNSSNPAIVQQIRSLPKDDALHLQLQIQDHLREKTKLKYELSVVEKRESRLQDKIKMLEAGMKVKGKTVYVTSATPTATVVSSQAASASNSVVVSPEMSKPATSNAFSEPPPPKDGEMEERCSNDQDQAFTLHLQSSMSVMERDPSTTCNTSSPMSKDIAIDMDLRVLTDIKAEDIQLHKDNESLDPFQRAMTCLKSDQLSQKVYVADKTVELIQKDTEKYFKDIFPELEKELEEEAEELHSAAADGFGAVYKLLMPKYPDRAKTILQLMFRCMDSKNPNCENT